MNHRANPRPEQEPGGVAMKPNVGSKRRVALAGAGYIADWHAK